MSEKNPWFEPGEPARPTDIKADKADLDMRLERKALAEGWDRTADKLDAAQSELSALREELARVNREKNDVAYRGKETAERLNSMTISKATMRNKLKQRLTAAEQRIADLCGLLVRTLPVVRMVGLQDHLCDYTMADNIQAEIETTLNPKPTESGASEAPEKPKCHWSCTGCAVCGSAGHGDSWS